MTITTQDGINCEINLKFISDVRNNKLPGVFNETPRSEDVSQYISRDDDYVLLSYSNN
jgi:hypothetical protein